tara:strand:+ start:19 stop:240 length:222 start_codon:yes stop_codon:yes gene_type:complete
MKYHIKRKKRIVPKWKGMREITLPTLSYCNRAKANFTEDAHQRMDGRYVLTMSSICKTCKNQLIKELFNLKYY